jgi:hypothetical protein
MLHMCVDRTLHLSGILIINGFQASHLLTASMPTIINIDVTPVSAIAGLVAIVIAFKDACNRCPNIDQAVAAIDCMLACVELQLQFEVATVTSLLSMTVANKFSMGSKELRCAVTKLFKLFAMTSFSLPPCHHWTCPFVDVGCQVLFSKTLVITFDQDGKAILVGWQETTGPWL